MPYKEGDRVTVRNRAAAWPGTVRAVLDYGWGPVYRVELDGGGFVVEASESFLEALGGEDPKPAEEARQ